MASANASQSGDPIGWPSVIASLNRVVPGLAGHALAAGCPRRSWASAGGGPAAGVVFEHDRFDEFADHCLLGVIEVPGGFEGEAQVVVGAAFVGVEKQAVSNDVERDGEVAQGVPSEPARRRALLGVNAR